MNSKLLLDTSFLLGLMNTRDKFHAEAIAFASTMQQGSIIPAPVLVELFQLLIQRVNYQAAIRGLERAQSSDFLVEPLTAVDRDRMVEIMRKYDDNELDYVDIAIMAISERLNISAICTFDDLDYRRFRTKHGTYLTILP